MKKKRSAAKVRYDAQHPVVSGRVSRADADRLRAVLKNENKSVGDFLKEAIGVKERESRAAYDEGFKRGYEKGRDDYAVWVSCLGCGDGIPVKREDMRERMGRFADLYYMILHQGCRLPEWAEAYRLRMLTQDGERAPGRVLRKKARVVP